MRIMIDCGHCLDGADTGAMANGYKEQILTREVGNEVKRILIANGHQCELTGVDTGYPTVNASLQARVARERAYKPDVFASIHFNAGGGTGTETYVLSKGGKAETYAKRVNDNIVNAMGYPNRGVKVGNFYVLRETNSPAILIECAFIDSKADMAKYNPTIIAKAIAEGLVGTELVDKPVDEDVVPDNENKKFYRIVCGTFAIEENADKLVLQLKSKGFDAFVERYTRKV